jgi:16S rRNA (adenine1518-N6/adenine1519-N6)-dimethyltransferase
VVAVEIDPVLAGALRDRDLPGVEVIEADALRLDPEAIEEPAPTRLVANLPYNVSVPVLLRVLETMPAVASGVVMVQAEVGERLAAAAGADAYGVPSAKAAWWAEVKLAGTVPRAVFWPVPNVDSVLVGFTRREAPAEEALRRSTFQAIDAAFAQRRKTLRSALAPWAGSPAEAERLLFATGIEPKTRGERLDVAAFAALAGAKRLATGAGADGE